MQVFPITIIDMALNVIPPNVPLDRDKNTLWFAVYPPTLVTT